MNLFVFNLHGGPYNGKQITAGDQTWRTELGYEDPYAEHGTAKAVYGNRDRDRHLYYWGSQPCHPKEYRPPVFRQR